MAGLVVAGSNGVVRHRIGTDEAHLLGFVVVVVRFLRRLVGWGRDAVGAGLFLGSTSRKSDILRGGLGGEVVLFGASTVASTPTSATTSAVTTLTGAVTSSSVAIAASARSLASAAASW